MMEKLAKYKVILIIGLVILVIYLLNKFGGTGWGQYSKVFGGNAPGPYYKNSNKEQWYYRQDRFKQNCPTSTGWSINLGCLSWQYLILPNRYYFEKIDQAKPLTPKELAHNHSLMK